MPFPVNDSEDLERAKPYIIGFAAFIFLARSYNHSPGWALAKAKDLWNEWYEEFNEEVSDAKE